MSIFFFQNKKHVNQANPPPPLNNLCPDCKIPVETQNEPSFSLNQQHCFMDQGQKPRKNNIHIPTFVSASLESTK